MPDKHDRRHHRRENKRQAEVRFKRDPSGPDATGASEKKFRWSQAFTEEQTRTWGSETWDALRYIQEIENISLGLGESHDRMFRGGYPGVSPTGRLRRDDYEQQRRCHEYGWSKIEDGDFEERHHVPPEDRLRVVVGRYGLEKVFRTIVRILGEQEDLENLLDILEPELSMGEPYVEFISGHKSEIRWD